MARLDLAVNVLVKGEQALKGLASDIDHVDDKAKGFGGRLGGALTGLVNPFTIAAGAAAGLGVALAGAAQSALEEEKGIAALTAALKANDPAAVAHIDQIEATIKARENLAFADDEQRESLAKLVSVTKDTGKALDLQRTAMDLARLRGMSLASASELIGKVYAGNLGILSRYGIQLAKGTTATEALAEIQRRAAGQAEEFANTTTGAVESMGIVWDDLTEDLGQLLLPVIRDIAIFVRDDLIPALRDIGPVIGDFLGFLGDNVIGPIAKGISMVADFVGFLGDAAESVRNFFGDTADHADKASKAETDFVEQSADNWESYTQTISDASEKAGDAVEELTQAEIQAIQDHWDDIRAGALETTIQYQLGLLDGQDRVKQGFAVLTRLQEEEMTKAQKIAYLQGQLASAQLQAGLNDSRPGVRGAANALRADIIAQLAALGVNAYASGYSVGANVAAGIYNSAHLADGASSYLAAKISGYLPRSNAKVGPLSDIMDVGGAIVRSVTSEIYGSIGIAERASASLASALALSPQTASALGPDVSGLPGGSGGLSGGVTIVLNVDGDLRASESTLPATLQRAVYVAGLTEEYEG